MNQLDNNPRVESPYMSSAEAAKYLGLTRSTIDHYRCSGQGPKYRKHGGRVFYHIEELDTWSTARRYKDTATRDK